MKFASMCLGGLAVLSFTLTAGQVKAEAPAAKAKVTGIGGVFILSKNSGNELTAWYAKHLGLQIETFGAAVLEWPEDHANDNGVTVWGTAGPDSQWFKPSESKFMINYRVDDLHRLIEQLSAEGIGLVAGPEYHENGVFAWIMDPEGNKIELWEPMAWDEKNKKTTAE